MQRSSFMCAFFGSMLVVSGVAAAPQQDDLLRGPEVRSEEKVPTLVVNSFDGRLVDVGPDVERAAIERLDLTEEQREAFEKVTGERAAAFDAIVRDQYGEISKLGGLRDDPAAFMRAIGELAQAFKPWSDRGTTLDEMRDHLTQEQIAHVERMVREYRAAQRAELERAHPDRRERRTALVRLRLEVFGALVTESIQRQIGFAKAQFDQIAQELNLTAEQKARTEAIFGPVTVAEFQGKATDAQRQQAMREFFALLDSNQRMKLLAILARDYKPRQQPEGETGDRGSDEGR